MKYCTKLFLFIFLFKTGYAQNDFDKLMKEGKQKMDKSDFTGAIDKYIKAGILNPVKFGEVKLKIDEAATSFNKMKIKAEEDALTAIKLKEDAIKQQEKLKATNENLIKTNDELGKTYSALSATMESLKTEKQNSDALSIKADAARTKAEANLKIAIELKKISDANRLIYEAQKAAGKDPDLGLKLTDTALKIIHGIALDDSVIYQNANKIYYENNFSTQFFNKPLNTENNGMIINTAFSTDGKSLWTITDSAKVLQWDLNGKIIRTIPLDKNHNKYLFKYLPDKSIFVYGYTNKIDNGLEKDNGHLWNLNNPDAKPQSVAFPEISTNIYPGNDSVYLLNADINPSKILNIGSRLIQVNNDGKLKPLLKISNNISNVACSIDGKLFAVSNNTRQVFVFDKRGRKLDIIQRNSKSDKALTLSNEITGIEFSPDNNAILCKSSNSLQIIYIYSDTDDYSLSSGVNITFFPNNLQTVNFSGDGNFLLTNCINKKNQQFITLYKKNKGNFEKYADFSCQGGKKTSAVFSYDNKYFLSSSDKIRKWEIPENQTETLDTFSFLNKGDSIFLPFSLEYDKESENIKAYTLDNNYLNLKFTGDNTLIWDNKKNPIPEENIQMLTKNKAFLSIPEKKKTAVISDDGVLKIYNSKNPLNDFLKNYRFQQFTDEQKKRYGLNKNLDIIE